MRISAHFARASLETVRPPAVGKQCNMIQKYQHSVRQDAQSGIPGGIQEAHFFRTFPAFRSAPESLHAQLAFCR